MSLAAVQSDVLLSLRRRQNIYINVCVSGVTLSRGWMLLTFPLEKDKHSVTLTGVFSAGLPGRLEWKGHDSVSVLGASCRI